jgi:hypothetical protein
VANSFEHANETSNSTAGVEFFLLAVKFFMFGVGNRYETEVILTLTSFSNLKSAEVGRK